MTDNELRDVLEAHKEGRCLPFMEFELKNSMILRFVRMSDRYVCIMRPLEANFFLTGDPIA